MNDSNYSNDFNDSAVSSTLIIFEDKATIHKRMIKELDGLINRLYANDPELTELDLHEYIEIRQISNEKWEELCNALVWNNTVHTLILNRSVSEKSYINDIYNEPLPPKRWVNLCKALKLNTGIKRLEMVRCHYSILENDGLEAFIEVISANRTLTSISFQWHYLGREDRDTSNGLNFQFLVDALRMNPKLVELDISDENYYYWSEAEKIINLIKDSNLKMLRFTIPFFIFKDKKREDTSSADRQMMFKEQFYKELRFHKHLKQVHLVWPPSGPPDLKGAQEELQTMQTKIDEILWMNKVRQEAHYQLHSPLLAAAQGLQKIKLTPNKNFDFLPTCLILHILSFLDPNNTRIQAMRQLEDHNNTLSKVTGLRMSKNEQFEYLTQRLSAQDKNLTQLNLSSKELWRMSEKRWADFCQALAHNQHLETLDLSLNALYQIDPKIWDYLAKALESNRTLKSIVLSHNFLQKMNLIGWSKFYTAVKKAPGSVTLDFCAKKESHDRYVKLGTDVALYPLKKYFDFAIGVYDLAETGIAGIVSIKEKLK